MGRTAFRLTGRSARQRFAAVAVAGATLLATAAGARAQVPVPLPAGTFTAVSLSGSHACALRADATIACWGRNIVRPRGERRRRPGTFRAVSAGVESSCAHAAPISTLALLGRRTSYEQSTPPAGSFTALSAGEHLRLRDPQPMQSLGLLGPDRTRRPRGPSRR